jgi:hypothetical protein
MVQLRTVASAELSVVDEVAARVESQVCSTIAYPAALSCTATHSAHKRSTRPLPVLRRQNLAALVAEMKRLGVDAT